MIWAILEDINSQSHSIPRQKSLNICHTPALQGFRHDSMIRIMENTLTEVEGRIEIKVMLINKEMNQNRNGESRMSIMQLYFHSKVHGIPEQHKEKAVCSRGDYDWQNEPKYPSDFLLLSSSNTCIVQEAKKYSCFNLKILPLMVLSLG